MATTRFAAAWRSEHSEQVGVLASTPNGLRVVSALDVPTRSHGLWAEPGDRFLSVARRPGDWVVRWSGQGRPLNWAWSEPGRAFNGHILAAAHADLLYTTETDLDNGAGIIGVRDRATLEKIDEWPCCGMDPHDLLWDEQGLLIVANGGIPTLPETGRLKIGLERMDASLVQLDSTGEVRGQWRLSDRRLSQRHLARNGAVVGVALQAEHDDPATKAAAPVLALFDGKTLRVCEPEQSVAGYGGDIAAIADLWAVSCPRAHGVTLWHGDGRWAGFQALPEACALAAGAELGWLGGREAVLGLAALGAPQREPLPASVQLDNHWLLLPPSSY